jgi:catalase
MAPTTTSSETPSQQGMKATQVITINPEYHGRNSENIHECFDAAEECFSVVKHDEKKILLSFLRTKLKGAAFKAIQYVTLETWDQMKDHLQRRFGVGDTIRYIGK